MPCVPSHPPVPAARRLPLALRRPARRTLPAVARRTPGARPGRAARGDAAGWRRRRRRRRPVPAGRDEARRAEILAIVDELRDDAARIRGLPWKYDVPADVITRDAAAEGLEKMIKEEIKPDEYERD